MKKIAVLVDFTPTTSVVLSFAEQIAKRNSCEVVLVHISEPGDPQAAARDEKSLSDLAAELQAKGIKSSFFLEQGSFFSVIKQSLERVRAGLVIIGTHGKRGLKQNLFGSNILKLVKMIQLPSLVVQEESTWPENGFDSVLVPIASHSSFGDYLRYLSGIINKDGLVRIYVIYKTDQLDEAVKNNLRSAQQLLDEMKMRYEVVEEDVHLHSIGYARQTLEHLRAHPASLVGIMAQVSAVSKYFGDNDKENILLNPLSVPVLCFDE